MVARWEKLLVSTCFTARVYTRRHLRLRTHELGMRTRTRALVYCLLLEQQPHTAGGPGPLLCRRATTFVGVRQPRSLPSLGTQRPYACAYARNNCTWAISWVPFRSEARNEAERAPAARARHRATWRHTLSSRARVMGIHVFQLAMDTRFQSLFLASLILLVGSPAAGAVSERVQKFISSLTSAEQGKCAFHW